MAKYVVFKNGKTVNRLECLIKEILETYGCGSMNPDSYSELEKYLMELLNHFKKCEQEVLAKDGLPAGSTCVVMED